MVERQKNAQSVKPTIPPPIKSTDLKPLSGLNIATQIEGSKMSGGSKYASTSTSPTVLLMNNLNTSKGIVKLSNRQYVPKTTKGPPPASANL